MNRLSSLLFAFAVLQCSVGLVNAGDINLGVSDFKCPTGYTVYPHPQQCELYYTCYNTQPTYLYQCRGNLLFDLVYDGCNWPEQTYCGNRTRPDQTTDLTTKIPSVAPETSPSYTSPKPITCPDDGFYPAFTDSCNSFFFTCLDGYPFSTNCPSYGVFEPVAKKCVSPNNSACKTAPPSTGTNSPVASSTTDVTSWITTSAQSVTPPKTTSAVPVTTTTTKTTAGGAFVCPGSGSYSDPFSCSHYYTCDNGNAYHFACPAGLVFNPVTDICDWPYSVPSCNGK